MKSFQQYLQEAIRPVPHIKMMDRSLEGYKSLLDDMITQTKGVLDPDAKQELFELIIPFYQSMKEVLLKYKQKDIGYSPEYNPKQ